MLPTVAATPNAAAVFALHAASVRDARRIHSLESEVNTLRSRVDEQNHLLACAQTRLTATSDLTPTERTRLTQAEKLRKRERAATRLANRRLRQQRQLQQQQIEMNHAYEAASSAPYERPSAAAASVAVGPASSRLRRKRGYSSLEEYPTSGFAHASSSPHAFDAQQRDRDHKRLLDREMDALKKEGQLATIMEG